MRKQIVIGAMLIFGLSAVRAEEPDSSGDAPAEEAASAPDTISAEPAPAPSARPARTPFNGQRKAAPRPQAQSSGGSSPEPSGSPAAAPETEASPEPSPSTYAPPASPPPSGSPALGGKIGSSWTPEGTGIHLIDAEYAKNMSAKKAQIDKCTKRYQAAVQNAHPRAFVGQPTKAQVTAANAAVKSAGLVVYGGGSLEEILKCGGTSADAVAVIGDMCRACQRPGQPLSSGCYLCSGTRHNEGEELAARSFCGGFAPDWKCFNEPDAVYHPTYDPAEALRRASFGGSYNGNVPTPFIAAQPQNHVPEVDMHKILKDRLAYFDSVKSDLDGYDPQLIYTLIMTGELEGKGGKCHFNGAECTNPTNMDMYRGMTLGRYLRDQKNRGG